MARITLSSPEVPETSQILTSGVNPAQRETHSETCVKVTHEQSLTFCGQQQDSSTAEKWYNNYQNHGGYISVYTVT